VPFSDDEIRAAIEALLEPGRFGEAERRVAVAAPQLQQVLAGVLAEGGWLADAREQALARIASIDEPEQRLLELRTLLAEETRVGMMVGVALGWELARELEG
jgi:aspartate/methionine/tyrosine aminotransferase